MDAADLRVFEAVARLEGMNRAAIELNTVQSNVTARIRLLEEEVGVPLFHRHSRGVVLTAAGRRLLPYAARAALLFAEARQAVEDLGSHVVEREPEGREHLRSYPLTLGDQPGDSDARLLRHVPLGHDARFPAHRAVGDRRGGGWNSRQHLQFRLRPGP